VYHNSGRISRYRVSGKLEERRNVLGRCTVVASPRVVKQFTVLPVVHIPFVSPPGGLTLLWSSLGRLVGGGEFQRPSTLFPCSCPSSTVCTSSLARDKSRSPSDTPC